MQSLLILIKKMQKFIRLDSRSKKAFLYAYMYTGFFRSFILFVPFKKLKKRMGKVKYESSYEIDEITYSEAVKVSKLVSQVSKHTLWESKCLVQALTAQKLLKKKVFQQRYI